MMLNTESLSDANNIGAKHSRLISDYKSLRDKHNLLKNALILEREKTKQLEIMVSESDMEKRKSIQEKESLTFRNDLLTKQINSLRDELDRERQRKSKKIPIIKGKEASPTTEEVEVIKEELMNKITECSALHSQISNLNFDYQMETNNFRSAITDLENQLRLVKDQSCVTETNLRKTLTNEMDERTVLENKLDKKESLIMILEKSKQELKVEIKELKHQISSCTINNLTTLEVAKDKEECSDMDSIKSKEITDLKKSESSIHSLASTPTESHFNSNEIYIYSLLDKIGQLEQKINCLELSNQITEKRMRIEKSFRDLYENFIVQKGCDLPTIEEKKENKLSMEDQHNNAYETMSKFYESKFLCLTKQIYQAIAKAALYYDETKSLECRIEYEKIERENYTKEIKRLKQQINSSQEDLEITRTQYDTKMRTMSIHIAELTSQLNCEKQHAYGDHLMKTTDNVSSIKSFINSLKK